MVAAIPSVDLSLEAPMVPPREVWDAMSAAEKRAFEVRAGEVLTEIWRAMGEGRPHSTAKGRALDVLRGHFDRSRRPIYLGSELPVLYPGERAFLPDVFAVLDVEDPGEADQRMAWSVVDEGRGLDFVLEVLHAGPARKDLVSNVRDYARLGIPEYFVYDRRTERLFAHRLTPKGYAPIPMHLGRYPSSVLGIDFSVIGGRLRFHAGTGELANSREIIDQLGELVRSVEERAEHAERVADEQQKRAEEQQQRAEEQQQRAEEQQKRAEEQQQRAEEQQKRAEQAVVLLRRAVVDTLAARGKPADDNLRARLDACDDIDELGRYFVAALEGTLGT